MAPEADTGPSRGGVATDAVTTAVLASITAVYLTQALNLPASGGQRTDLGPRVYPLLAGALLGLTTLMLGVLTIRHWRRLGRPATSDAPRVNAPRTDAIERCRSLAPLLCEVVFAALYLWVLPTLGFVIATFVFLAVQVPVLAGSRIGRNWKQLATSALFGAVGSLAIYALFDGFLGVFLPAGLWAPIFG